MKIISRQAAMAAGQARFFLGTPCRLGHVCERFVSSKGCVECSAARRKAYRAKNAERVREARRAYDRENRSAINQQARAWQKANADKVKESLARWHRKNRDQQAAYRRAHKAERNESNRRRGRERNLGDPLFVLQRRVRARVGSAFRRIGYRKDSLTARLLGCSWPELKRHIEKQFLPGMTWENRGAVWHIDHILAIAEARTPEDVAALCHFTNLRPLWALDNQKKGAKRLHLI